VSVTAQCDGCAHVHSESYRVQGDSGHVVYCTRGGEERRIGDTTWNTPDWCPLLPGAFRRLAGELFVRAATGGEEG
jgi:hypothetical protein